MAEETLEPKEFFYSEIERVNILKKMILTLIIVIELIIPLIIFLILLYRENLISNRWLIIQMILIYNIFLWCFFVPIFLFEMREQKPFVDVRCILTQANFEILMEDVVYFRCSWAELTEIEIFMGDTINKLQFKGSQELPIVYLHYLLSYPGIQKEIIESVKQFASFHNINVIEHPYSDDLWNYEDWKPAKREIKQFKLTQYGFRKIYLPVPVVWSKFGR